MTIVNLINYQQTLSNTRFSSTVTSIKATSITAEMSFSISAQEEPLKLTYQAAIDRINEEVAPYLGEQALQRGLESGLDVSPQATADRIVSLSTAMFKAFQQQNPNDAFDAVLNRFIDVLTSGVEQGFAEAKDILSGLDVLEGETETNIDLTFELVLEGFASFTESRRDSTRSLD